MINKLKVILKIGIEYLSYYNIIKKLDKNKNVNIIMGTPVHENLGDHLIAYSEKCYLEQNANTKDVVEIPIEAYMLFKQKLIENVSERMVIFINGGGWMGNLWPVDEVLLEDIIISFPNNKIIVFPQTIFFDNKLDNFDSILDRSVKVFEGAKDLTLYVRDEQSFGLAKKLYKKTPVYLIPDITFFLKDNSNIFSEVINLNTPVVGLCLRNDREKKSDDTIISQCIRHCLNRNFATINVSTTRRIRIPSFARKYALQHLIKQFKKCRLIITDRLHGMIFAYLSGVPCIVFDNYTGKISGTYNLWLKKTNIIYMVDNENQSELIKIIDNYLDEKKWYSNEKFDFSRLEDVIQSGKN